MTAEHGRRPVWIIISILIALLGIGASIYSIVHHLEVHAHGHTSAACNINATFSCDQVSLSKYSEIAGVPLGVFGLGYFAAALILLGVALAGAKTAADHLHGYAAMVGIGVLTSLVLGGISISTLGTYCVVCIGVYVLTLLQAVALVIGRRDLIPPGFTFKSATNGGVTAAIAVALIVAGFNFLRPSRAPVNANTLSLPSQDGKKLDLSPKSDDIPWTKSAYAGLGEDYRRGNDSAKVVIQEFADFECPACGHMAKVLDQLHQEYGDKILIIFRNFPLDNTCNSAIQNRIHEYACKAAIMGRCAGQYGKFWDYFALAYGHQSEMTNDKLKEWGSQLGLTPDQIATCWDSKDLLNKVQDDVALATRLGVDATPTLYVNNHRVIGNRGIDDLRSIINRAME